MDRDRTVRIRELPSWWKALFRSRENDRAKPSAFPYESLPYPIPRNKAGAYEKKLNKLRKYAAQSNKECARPLHFLVAREYQGRSHRDLMRLPVKAIRNIDSTLATQLTKKGISSVDGLAHASMTKLMAIGISQEGLALAHSYAKDILKHATVPQIAEYPLPLEEMLKPKYASARGKELLNLPLDAMQGINKSTTKKIKVAGIANKIGDLEDVTYDTLVTAGVSSQESFLLADQSAMILGHAQHFQPGVAQPFQPGVAQPFQPGVAQPFQPGVGKKPELGTLRVLLIDGLLRLSQKVTVAPGDPTEFELPEYPLDNPNKGRAPEEIATEPYVGYIISADEIIICESIVTNGNDLVLAAKTIRIGDVGAITINTRPNDFTEAANLETDGVSADNGGDLVFLCQQFIMSPACVFTTSGGVGQDGGTGRSMTKLEYIEEGVHIDTPIRTANIFGVFLGMLGTGQCKFHLDPNDWDEPGIYIRPISFSDYNKRIFGGSVDISGEWTLLNGMPETAPCYLTNVTIPDPCYPTGGRPGGYGGNPGKISLIMPKPSDAKGIDALQVEAVTGGDGKPGLGGMGGDWTPSQVRRLIGGGTVSQVLPVADYIKEYSINKPETVYRGEPGESVPAYDVFNRIQDERLDGQAITDRLKDSICGVTFAADVLVFYYPNLPRKLTGQATYNYVWNSVPWPLSILVSTLRSGGGYSALSNQCLTNGISPPTLNSLRLYVDSAPKAQQKAELPRETRSLVSLSKNWYQAIYELVSEYPLTQYEQADTTYRQGNFDKAAEFYSLVLSFAQEVPDFLNTHITVVCDARYRLDMISSGYDYFGFSSDTLIPTSPTRDYLPLPLATTYSDTVQFYQTAIRDTYDTITTIEMGRDVLRQFLRQHQLTIADIQESILLLETFDLRIIEAETDALVQEINALRWQNQRLSGLLQLWCQRVNDKIKELQKEKEDKGAGWWDAVIAVWNVILLVASIVAVCYGFASAAAASVYAVSNLAKLGDNISDLRLAIKELVNNLTEWSSEEIAQYLDEMGDVAKELQASYDKVKEAWNEAISKLEEFKKQFSETQEKFNQLSAVNMTDAEAIDFKNNVLLADEVGVSGAMNYLQIQEQIYFNNDMMSARYQSVEALTEKRMKATYQAISLMREMVTYTAESKHLGELLDVYTWNSEQKQAALDGLTHVGQHSLDALMHRLARQTRQLKFLNLDTKPLTATYAYRIEEEAHVGEVLQAKDQLVADMMKWIENNNNIARLKVVFTKDPSYALNIGGITIVAPGPLAEFSRGHYLRSSRILEIEPLRETRIVKQFAEGISNRRTDPAELGRLLISQFLTREGDVYHLIPPDSLGFDVSPEVVQIIVSRERYYHPSLSTSAAGTLDDTTVVLAYSLARGDVTLLELTNLLQQMTIAIPDPLRSRIEALRNAWVALSTDISDEDVKSLRSVVGAIGQAAGNPVNMRAILDEALIAGGQFVCLDRFHLDQQDIQGEIANSFDPDVEEDVLANVYGTEPGHIVAAVTLLYAGLDATELGSLAGEYATNSNPLGDYITNVLKAQWDMLQASVLEKRHSIEISIRRDDYMAIPNASETFREMRYLAARARIPADIELILEKLPPDLYLRETEDGITINIEVIFEKADDVVSQAPIATPPALNMADVHFCDLFGRSILGKWTLGFTYKGNRPVLPPLDLVEMEFLYTYLEHD